MEIEERPPVGPPSADASGKPKTGAPQSIRWDLDDVIDIAGLFVAGLPLLALSFASCWMGYVLIFGTIGSDSRKQVESAFTTMDEHWRTTVMVLLPLILPALARLARRLRAAATTQFAPDARERRRNPNGSTP